MVTRSTSNGQFVQINLEFTDVEKSLDLIESRMHDLSPVAPDIAIAIQADVDNRFSRAPKAEQGGPVPGGVYWAPLSEAYLLARDKYKAPGRSGIIPRRGGRILRDEGELLNSLQGTDHPNNIFEEFPDSVQFGTNLPQAVHNTLSKKPRPFLFIPNDGSLTQVVANIWQQWILEGKK